MKIIGIVNKLSYETLGVYVCEGPFMTKSRPKLKQGPGLGFYGLKGLELVYRS